MLTDASGTLCGAEIGLEVVMVLAITRGGVRVLLALADLIAVTRTLAAGGDEALHRGLVRNDARPTGRGHARGLVLVVASDDQRRSCGEKDQ